MQAKRRRPPTDKVEASGAQAKGKLIEIDEGQVRSHLDTACRVFCRRKTITIAPDGAH